MVQAQASSERLEKNVMVMKKMAESNNAATMKMMDEKDTASSSGKSSSRDNSAVEKLRKENASLNEKLGSTTKELEVVKNQAKGFEREHDRLLSQIQKLENQLDKNPSEAKKQK